MKNQIVILAAGASSRFYPFNQDTHKSMFSICGKPVIGWTLEGLKKINTDEIIIVISKKDKNIKEYLNSFKGLNIKLAYQEESLGMGDALLSAKKFLRDEFIVGFPHFVNPKIFEMLFKNMKNGKPAILADETQEPWKYGILKVKENKAFGIIEKPKKGTEPSRIRASGVYFLNKNFLNILESMGKSEYNFEEALDKFMKVEEVEIILTQPIIIPLKYPWDIFSIKDYLLENIPEKRAKSAQIFPTATLRGKVILEDGAKVFDYATIEGPVYIGKDAVIGAYCTLRDHSVLEEGAEIQRYADCTRSIFEDNSHLHSGFVGDSIIGKSVRLGSNFIVANRRIDRKDIEIKIKDERISTFKSYLGVLIGDSVRTGINVATMPGVIIGANSVIGPDTTVMNNIEPDTLAYTEHKQIIKTKKIK